MATRPQIDIAQPGPDAVARTVGLIALIGVSVFAITCGAAQFLRTDYNWLGMPLSFYVLGPYGRMVEAGYFVLAPGLVALGIGWYHALDRSARRAAPLLLFVLGAIALVVTAVEFTDMPERPHTLHGSIHVLAAAVTFFSVTIAMLLQSWRLRTDPRWRHRFRSAFTLAAITFVALWVYALERAIPRGIGEKVVIVLILAWLWRAGWWLARDRTG
ncbi:MAG: DUF998 domain-containing protein [Rhodanobacteraceae bacterium]